MCKYKYDNKNSNRNGQSCIYPEFYLHNSDQFKRELLIDEEGYCLFHSKNDKWKIKNGFKESLFELIEVLSEINSKKEAYHREFFFSGFNFPNYESILFSEIPFLGYLILSNCIFNSKIEFDNLTVNSLNTEHSTFNERVFFNKVNFLNGIESNQSTYNNGLSFRFCELKRHFFFNDCYFNNISNSYNCELGFKSCKSIHYLSLQNTSIKTRFTILKSTINSEILFNNSTLEDEFIIENCKIDGTISFQETEFTLKQNGNPYMSSTHFENNDLGERGRIVFRGKWPQYDMIRNEMTLHFNEKPKGIILFENFNLNKILPKSKERLFKWEKEGIVEIGPGCRKYYCQTEVFTIKATKAIQTLILDIAKIFCNYFELQESSNLGIEILERKESLIKYFYFTDEKVSLEKFLEQINNAEYNIWKTFSNLTNYSSDNFSNIEEQHLFLDLGILFLKLGNYVNNGISLKDNIPKLLNSIAAKAVTNIDNSNNIVINIEPGKSVVQPTELYEFILNAINKYSNSTPKLTINMKVKQIFNGQIENVINADNYFQGNGSNSTKHILNDIDEISKEESSVKKESKWEKFLKKWAGTISDVTISGIKGFILP